MSYRQVLSIIYNGCVVIAHTMLYSLLYFVELVIKKDINMVAAIINEVEDKIRNLCLTKRLRPSEFFIDYDRLRSGYVTGTPHLHWSLYFSKYSELFIYFEILLGLWISKFMFASCLLNGIRHNFILYAIFKLLNC